MQVIVASENDFWMASTETRNTGTPWNTPEHQNSRRNPDWNTKFDSVVFFPITGHVKIKCQNVICLPTYTEGA